MSDNRLEKHFPNENVLQNALVELLDRIGLSEGIEILQGPQETGKDIIFYIKGGFAEAIPCACVVKNTKITGQVSTNIGARTVFFQALQVLDTPHTDSSGKEVRLERVYVVTPFELSPTAITSIKGGLRDRAGQVIFVAGQMLADLFAKYWPDFFPDEAEILKQHLVKTIEVFEGESALAGLAVKYHLPESNAYPKKIYVSQSFQRDFNFYNLGRVLTTPFVDRSLSELNSSDLGVIRVKLDTFAKALRFLHQWDFCNGEDLDRFVYLSSQVKAEIEETINAEKNRIDSLVNQINYKQERDKNLRDEIKEEDDLVLELNRPVLDIYKSSTFRELLKELSHVRRHSCRIVKIALATQKSLLSSKNFSGAQALADPSFLYSCLIDDCASSSPTGLFNLEKGRRVKLNFPEDVLDGHNNFLMIIGEPGYGKTSFCRWHAFQDAANFTLHTSNVIPIHLPLRQLAREMSSSFEETFLGKLSQSALLGLKGNRPNIIVRLYLDGLDEVTSPEKRHEIIDLLRTGMGEKEAFQAILTSRPFIYDKKLEWIPRIALAGFGQSEIEELADKWLGEDTEQKELFWHQLNKTPALRDLMRVPLLATLILIVYRDTGTLTSSKAKLYDIFIDLLSGGWDSVKGVVRESKFTQRRKVTVLSRLAAELHQGGGQTFTDNNIKDALRYLLMESLLDHREELRDELIADGLITRSGDKFQFSHLSFQDFLTAKAYIGSSHSLPANRALENYITGDDRWKGVLTFYIELSNNPRDVLNWLTTQIGLSTRRSRYVESFTSSILNLYRAVLEAFPGTPMEYVADQVPDIVPPQQVRLYLSQYQDRGN